MVISIEFNNSINNFFKESVKLIHNSPIFGIYNIPGICLGSSLKIYNQTRKPSVIKLWIDAHGDWEILKQIKWKFGIFIKN